MKKTSIFAVFVSSIVLVACSSPDSGEDKQQKLLPGADFVADAKQGKVLFEKQCARCHGPGAKGSDQGPPLIHDIYRPGHHADMSFYWAVKDGSTQHHWHFGNMPPIKGVSPDDVGHIIAYIRREQRMNGIR